jgi:hypothetical protein
MTATTVRDVRPPPAVVRGLNPILRALLHGPLGRRMGALATLELEGRRTARPLRVVVAWYPLDDGAVVVTPASWRANFTDGWPATVCHRGQRTAMRGELVRAPADVVELLHRVVDAGAGRRAFGLVVEPGHRLDERDVVATDRQAIVFRPV